jgi:hypothetical protein
MSTSVHLSRTNGMTAPPTSCCWTSAGRCSAEPTRS